MRVSYKGQKVCTTKQLAEFYGCSEKNIKDNYQNNADRFVDGVHYFKLEGAELRAFKRSLTGKYPGSEIPHQTRNLSLWTEKGAARHAKMLSTDRAWDVFEEMEDTYFAVTGMAKAIGYEGSTRLKGGGCRRRVLKYEISPYLRVEASVLDFKSEGIPHIRHTFD